MNYLHEYCNVFISVGYNMHVSQQVLKATLLNSIPITLSTSGFVTGRTVVGNDQQIIYPDRPVARLYNGKDTWSVPSTVSLSKELYNIHLDLTNNSQSLVKTYLKIDLFKQKMPKVIKSKVKLCLQ